MLWIGRLFSTLIVPVLVNGCVFQSCFLRLAYRGVFFFAITTRQTSFLSMAGFCLRDWVVLVLLYMELNAEWSCLTP
jgi:hypothetical protein